MARNARKLIGEGLQFRVYELGKRRVLKIPTTHAQKLATLTRWRMPGRAKREALARGTAKTLDRSLRGLRAVLPHIDAALLGNHSLLPLSQYEQDRMETLGIYFKGHTLAENKKIVRAYVESIIEGWRYGFADIVFNFTINNGVEGGRVLILDLGELTFSKAKVRNQVRKKQWRTKWSYTSMTDARLKKYLDEVMRRRLTLRTLEKNWGASLPGRRLKKRPIGA